MPKTQNVTPNLYEKLTGCIAKMKKNRENVPFDELTTKYKKSYEALIKETKQYGTEAMVIFAFGSLQMKDDDTIDVIESFQSAAEDVCQSFNENGFSEKAGDALSVYCSLDLFLLYASYLKIQMERKYYADYWLKNTSVSSFEGRYYNKIINMYYEPEYHIWVSKDRTEFLCAYPPTEAEMKRYLDKSENPILDEIKKMEIPKNVVKYVDWTTQLN